MPPTSKKLRGHIGLGLSLRLSVRKTFGSWETQEPLMLESWNFICGMYMKNKRTRIFFLRRSCRSGVMPLFRLCMNNPLSRISEKPLWLGSWYLAYSYRPRCRWTDNFWTYSVKFRLSYSPFSDTGILYRNNLVNKISEEPLWLGSWYLAYSYRPRCKWTDQLLNLFPFVCLSVCP